MKDQITFWESLQRMAEIVEEAQVHICEATGRAVTWEASVDTGLYCGVIIVRVEASTAEEAHSKVLQVVKARYAKEYAQSAEQAAKGRAAYRTIRRRCSWKER